MREKTPNKKDSKSRSDVGSEKTSDKKIENPSPKKEAAKAHSKTDSSSRSYKDYKSGRSKSSNQDKKKWPYKKRSAEEEKEMKPYQIRDSERAKKENRENRGSTKRVGKSRVPKSFDAKKPFEKRKKTFKKEETSSSNKSNFSKREYPDSDDKKPFSKKSSGSYKDYKSGKSYSKDKKSFETNDETIRLNRFISNAGICGRREADNLITAGDIKVNGKRVTEVGTKVHRSDRVTYLGKSIRSEKPVYILLNKPKGFITTMNDPKGRKTVMELVSSHGKERIYPVGRLDKDTTGLLLLTNDGELTKKLTHPSHEVRKLYHVTVQKDISDEDIEKISKGFKLEDGFIKADKVSHIAKADKNEIGIELHSGKNRIVRRIMEHLGYDVIKLDRVILANLNKKDIPRGKWRKLSQGELGLLKRIAGKKHESED